MDRYEIYRKALEKNGKEMQTSVAIEEMAELTKELIKNKRGEYNVLQIAEEVADVWIMLEQLIMIYGIDKYVEAQKEKKVVRLAKRLNS